MKILLIGFLVFFGWSALSTHLYVCKIKGLCNETITMQTEMAGNTTVIVGDTLKKNLVQEQAVIPENLVVYFAFDKSEFSPDGATDKYFEKSNIYLNHNSQAMLSITGYTDEIGSDEYNQALGYRRAQCLQKYFESKGIPADKVKIESRGEKEPAENNTTPAGRANNRRTVITIK